MIHSRSIPSSVGVFTSLLVHWELIKRLVRREIEARYRGSLLGLLWVIILPIVMLIVYTFVFTVIFKARWSSSTETHGEFALLIFSGLIVFNFFAESLNRAPGILLENVNYIKKVVFPLEILSWVIIGTALFNAFTSFMVLLVGYAIIIGTPPITALLYPLMVLPLIFFTFGVTCFLASVGIFVRDVKHIVAVCTTILMFLSPIFYPVESLPTNFQKLVYANPMTVVLEITKDVLFWGKIPDPLVLSIYLVISLITAKIGLEWFLKTKKGFADVV